VNDIVDGFWEAGRPRDSGLSPGTTNIATNFRQSLAQHLELRPRRGMNGSIDTLAFQNSSLLFTLTSLSVLAIPRDTIKLDIQATRQAKHKPDTFTNTS